MADLMAEASDTPERRASKAVRLVLQRLAAPGTASAIAVAIGESEATVSRLKTEHLERLCRVLAHAGLKVVPAEKVCVDRETYESVARIAARAMADEPTVRRLMWDDD